MSELGIRNVLVVQVSPHCRRAVQETDAARRMMYAAREEQSLPSGIDASLLCLHDRRPFVNTPAEIAELAAELRDDSFRIEKAAPPDTGSAEITLAFELVGAHPAHGTATFAYDLPSAGHAFIDVIDVAGWYDAGKLDTLLATNRVMLEKGRALRPKTGVTNTETSDPVRIEEGAVVKDSYVGPNVVIGKGTVVTNCTLVDTIIGEDCRITGCTLGESMIGDNVVVEGITGSVSLGDHAEVRAPAP